MTDDIPSYIGQQAVIDALVKVAGQKMAYGHAYLLSGADTVAVGFVARWLESFLVCSAPVGNASCGSCQGCNSRRRGDGVWTLRLTLEAGEQAHNIERIRSLRHYVGIKPVAEGRRVVLVESADLLRGAAANALLKNIEEPAAGLVYIMTAQHASAVLPTIRSRAMSMVIQSVPQHVLMQALVQKGHTRNAVDFACTLYPGQAGRAVALLEDTERFRNLHDVEKALAGWQELPTNQRFRKITEILEGYTESNQQRQRVLDALHIAARKHSATAPVLRALLNACLALRTNAQPKLIFDAFALQTL